VLSDFDRRREIIEFIKRCGIPDVDKLLSRCETLKVLLLEENSKHNLTRITSDFDYWNKHIADSASMGLFFKDKLLDGIKIADIGCGAGFPSIVLAIAFQKTEITAIDSVGKKAEFVRLAKGKLALDNLTVVTGRARELKFFGKFDIITARAVGEPIKIFRESRAWLSKCGSFVLYQTPSICSEVDSLNRLTCGYGICWKATEQFALPGGENRTFLYSKKLTDF
jgi:16S rRNA (guanine527-N7)-methyltransferase